jgi:hypothetical protein
VSGAHFQPPHGHIEEEEDTGTFGEGEEDEDSDMNPGEIKWLS